MGILLCSGDGVCRTDEREVRKTTPRRRPDRPAHSKPLGIVAAMRQPNKPQAWDLAFDPATGFRRRQEDVPGTILPSDRWPNFFSRVVAKLQWDEQSIDLANDAQTFQALPDERRERLTKIRAGFRVRIFVSRSRRSSGSAWNVC